MNKKSYAWLVVGGAGYIGSHVARTLKKNGNEEENFQLHHL